MATAYEIRTPEQEQRALGLALKALFGVLVGVALFIVNFVAPFGLVVLFDALVGLFWNDDAAVPTFISWFGFVALAIMSLVAFVVLLRQRSRFFADGWRATWITVLVLAPVWLGPTAFWIAMWSAPWG